MCDTMIATPEITADAVMLFGKNSDRDPNEAQFIEYHPAADHPAGENVQCTYIPIPQAAHTHAVLLSKPFWIWGAEMGVNEHGLAIGNEAVFSKVAASKESALLGMDLLRLGLERASSAEAAVAVITGLLEAHGQGGQCGFTHESYYHNSFLIADPTEAWVLETVDRHWAAKRVSGVYTISNGLTIGADFDKASPDLVNFAIEKGWCKYRDGFDFARCYSDFLFTTFGRASGRCGRTRQLLSQQRGQITPQTIIQALRDHGEDAGQDWRPDHGLTNVNVCMHASFGPIRFSQTTGSMVCHLHPTHPTHFVTGTAAPCAGIFKPVWLDAQPDFGSQPTGTFDPETLFWRHERLHRAVLADYPTRMAAYQKDRDQLENDFIQTALQLASSTHQEKQDFATVCFQRAWDSEDAWLDTIEDLPIKGRRAWLHRSAWNRFNRQADFPPSESAE